MVAFEAAIAVMLASLTALGGPEIPQFSAQVSPGTPEDRDDEFVAALSSITIGSETQKYLRLSSSAPDKSGECFENPQLAEINAGGQRLHGIVLAVEISNDRAVEYHEAFLQAARTRPKQLCLPDSIEIRGERFWLGRIDPVSLSRHSRRPGSTQWRQTSHGMAWIDHWGRQKTATFEELKRRVGASRSTGLMSVLFGRAEQFVGIRITSIPAGATLVVDGKRTRVRTNGDVWLSGSSIARAQLQFSNGMRALEACAVKPLPGRLVAELECRPSR